MNSAPMVGGARLLVTVALAASSFMQALDSSIANVAIPSLSGDLGISTTQGTWVITSFTVSNAIAVPLTGWLARRFGEVRLFVIAVLLFSLASWGCGLSTSIGMLVIFRVVQGAVAGPMIPLSQTLLLSIYPPEKRGSALALASMTTLVAPIFGPILGGWITDNISWPWIFYINVPIGLACAYVSWPRLRDRESVLVRQPIDGIGLALLVLGVGCLQLLLDQGRELDWFHSDFILILSAIATVALSALVIWELTDEHPVIDLHFLGQRNFTVGTLVLSMAFMVYFGSVVILPLWLQTQLGYTASWAGWVMAPTGLFAIVLMPLVGRYLFRIDVRYLASFSFIVFAGCWFWRSTYNTSVNFGYIILPQIFQGIGTACLFLPLTSIVISGLPQERMASAVGLSSFIRILAGSFGTSLITTMWDRRASVHHALLTEQVSQYNPVFAGGMLQSLRSGGASVYAGIEQLITQQAYMLSTIEIFWASGWIFLSLIPFVWLAKKPQPGKVSRAVVVAE